MIKATNRAGNKKNRADVIYSENFARDGRGYINGSAAPDDFWTERSGEETHRNNRDMPITIVRMIFITAIWEQMRHSIKKVFLPMQN